MKLMGSALALLIGGLLPLQALINARLGQLTQGPLFASLISFLVGTVALSAAWLTMRPSGAGIAALTQVPAWTLAGGLIGAVFVAVATVLIPRMGAAALICLVVFGQMIGSLLLDHFGVLHARQPIDALRLAGIALMAIGALLVVRPWQSAS